MEGEGLCAPALVTDSLNFSYGWLVGLDWHSLWHADFMCEKRTCREIDIMMPIQEASFVHKYKTDRSGTPSTQCLPILAFSIFFTFHIRIVYAVPPFISLPVLILLFRLFSDFCSSNAVVVCDSYLIEEYQSSSTRYQTFFGSASLRRSMWALSIVEAWNQCFSTRDMCCVCAYLPVCCFDFFISFCSFFFLSAVAASVSAAAAADAIALEWYTYTYTQALSAFLCGGYMPVYNRKMRQWHIEQKFQMRNVCSLDLHIHLCFRFHAFSDLTVISRVCFLSSRTTYTHNVAHSYSFILLLTTQYNYISRSQTIFLSTNV